MEGKQYEYNVRSTIHEHTGRGRQVEVTMTCLGDVGQPMAGAIGLIPEQQRDFNA